MKGRIVRFMGCMMVMGPPILPAILKAQLPDTSFILSCVIYDEAYRPLPATHVINLASHAGDVTDSLGIFRLPARTGEILLIRHIAYQDTLVPAELLRKEHGIVLKPALYPLQEARIFRWGSTYGDFREAIIQMPNRETLGESLGLPRQDPDHVPFEMDDSRLKNPGFLIKSPISYAYYNLSRKEKSRRKIYWLQKNQEKHRAFDEILSPDNISGITGLSGEPLLPFMAYLQQFMVCDFKCTEIDVYSEIYRLWEAYRQSE
jgi:hypothetical protein